MTRSSLPERRLTPDEINRLPLASYGGPLHLVRTPTALRQAIEALSRETLLGFDTETRPAFRKGESHPPALLQLAGAKAVYLFQLHALGLPPGLIRLLADARLVKAGVAISRDVHELRALADFEPRGFVDLGARAASCGIQHQGLRGLAAVLLGCRVSKGAQLTNWARPELPPAALRYAATDAWICRRLYDALSERGSLDSTVTPDRRPGRRAGHGHPHKGGRAALWHMAKAALASLVRGRGADKGTPGRSSLPGLAASLEQRKRPVRAQGNGG